MWGMRPLRSRFSTETASSAWTACRRGAAALVRRLERRLGCRVTEARVAPLRAVDTTTLAIPAAPPATGRLRLIAAGVATPGGTGAWAGVPLWLDRPLPAAWQSGHVEPLAAARPVPRAAGP